MNVDVAFEICWILNRVRVIALALTLTLFLSGPTWARTMDPLIMSQVL